MAANGWQQPQTEAADRQASAEFSSDHIATLEMIQQRVLWLATHMIHHANLVRPNPDGTKIGGHQASSASVVSIMTALYFHFLQAGDRLSIKPHASPVLHAVHYLLGQLSRDYLTTLRAYKGLQAYPSRTKDPDPVDFSTGSVGLGAVAPAFGALLHKYTRDHFDQVTSRRFIGLIGDAELDEGNVWEAVLDPALRDLGNLLLIVDLNRQSLDRVIPGIKAAQLQNLFQESGWQVLEVKYGRRLQAQFRRPGGEALRRRIDEMSNEEYQALIALPGDQLRPRLIGSGRDRDPVAALLAPIADADLPSLLNDLGGHDMAELLAVLAQAEQASDKPTIIFAYTIKGWGLPIAGHPLNHSMLLSEAQIEEVRGQLGIGADDVWAKFAPDSAPGRLCAAAAARIFPSSRPPQVRLAVADVPDSLGVLTNGTIHTQQTFGRLLTRLARPSALADRLLTVSPDVSVSTNLSGWIVKRRVYGAPQEESSASLREDPQAWHHSPRGQHIELGISEMNLFMVLGTFGLSADLCGQQVIPIGTVYDPFVCRGLDALIHALYSGGRFIFAGTPSGISLAPEGGAHQSIVTPGLGMELPNLNAFEPCFALELEWQMIEALRQCCDAQAGRATYFRLSTKPIDQALLAPALARLGEAELRRQVLAGGYRLVDWRSADPMRPRSSLVHLAASGAMIPEAVEAAAELHDAGFAVNVLNLTSPRRLYEAWRAVNRAAAPDGGPFDWLIPPSERHAPIVTVHDGASHALAWLGSVYGNPVVPLGVDQFGQSGSREELYHHYGIDAASIIAAANGALRRHGIFALS